MTVNQSALLHRLRIASEDLDTIQRKVSYLGVKGGHPAFTRVEFHERRVTLLTRMLTMNDVEVQAEHDRIVRLLGPAVQFKYGDVAFLPEPVAQNLALLELIEYATGGHPSQQGHRAS